MRQQKNWQLTVFSSLINHALTHRVRSSQSPSWRHETDRRHNSLNPESEGEKTQQLFMTQFKHLAPLCLVQLVQLGPPEISNLQRWGKKRARNKKPTGCLAASASSTLLRPILTILLAVVGLKVEALIAFAHAESVYIHNPTSVLQTKKYRKESGPTGWIKY